MKMNDSALKPGQLVAVWNYNAADIHIRMFHHMERRGLLEEARNWFICRNPLQTNSADFDAWLFARPLSEIEPDAFL